MHISIYNNDQAIRAIPDISTSIGKITEHAYACDQDYAFKLLEKVQLRPAAMDICEH